MVRELTKEEVQKMFLDYIWHLVNEYNNLPTQDVKYKLYQLAHSIILIIDGCNDKFPSFILAPDPQSNDINDFLVVNKKNYFPENTSANVKCDISGDLHHNFCWNKYQEQEKLLYAERNKK